jgi:far upstream element-binding protein
MGGGDGYGRGGSSSTIQIPSAKVGLVIGRRGETIRDLQDRSGARIAVTPTPQDHNSPSRTVTITGDDSAIERAKTFIEEIVNDMAPRGAYGGGGFQNTPPVTMTVPQESIGLVIGRGGETVKQLQIQSRAKIQVQQVDPSVPAPAERTINLFGPPEAVEYAKQLIMEKVNGAVSRLTHWKELWKRAGVFLIASTRRCFLFSFFVAMPWLASLVLFVVFVLVWKEDAVLQIDVRGCQRTFSQTGHSGSQALNFALGSIPRTATLVFRICLHGVFVLCHHTLLDSSYRNIISGAT